MADGEIVQKVTDAVKQGGSGFFNRLFMGIPNVLGGMGHGVWSNTVGNLSGLLMTAAGFMGTAFFAPELVKWLPFKVNGKKVGETLGEKLDQGGTMELVKQAGMAALVVNGVIGGVKGTIGGVSETVSGEDNSFMSKVGGIIGGGAVAAAIGMVAMSAVKKNDIGFVGNADAFSNKQPNIPPAATNNQEVSGKNA